MTWSLGVSTRLVFELVRPRIWATDGGISDGTPVETVSSLGYPIDDKKPDPEMIESRLLAYRLYFGVCIGARRGNTAAIKISEIYPDSATPHFVVADNIISGRGRMKKGFIKQKNKTKTDSGKQHKLPMIQPSQQVLIEVARFVKAHAGPDEILYNDKLPDRMAHDWYVISKECNFRWITPLDWRHTYASIGAMNLHTLYKGNKTYLQKCCMHTDFRTTEGYIEKFAPQFMDDFLDAFAIAESDKKKAGS